MKFEADLTAAKSAVDKFYSDVQGRPLRIPLNAGDAGSIPGQPTPASTLGGLTTSTLSSGAASPNLANYFTQLGREFQASLSAAFSNAVKPLTSAPGGPGRASAPPKGDLPVYGPDEFDARQQRGLDRKRYQRDTQDFALFRARESELRRENKGVERAKYDQDTMDFKRFQAGEKMEEGGEEGGESPNDGPRQSGGTRGRQQGLFGRRAIYRDLFGGDARLGALAFTGVQIAQAYRQNSIENDLAGGNSTSNSTTDLREQLKADQSFQKRIEGVGFGILGGVASFISDPFGNKQIGIERTLKSADATDAQTRAQADSANYFRRVANETAIAKAGSPQQQQEESLFRKTEESLIQNKAERDKRLAANNDLKNVELQKAGSDPYQIKTINQRYLGLNNRIADKFAGSAKDIQTNANFSEAEIGRQRRKELSGLTSSEEANRLRLDRRDDEAELFALKKKNSAEYNAINPLDTNLRNRTEAAGKSEVDLLSERQRIAQTNRDIGFGAAVSTNLATARNDPLSASLGGIYASTRQQANTAQAQDVGKVIAVGLSEAFKTIATTRRGLDIEATGLESSAEVTRLQIGRNPLGAQLKEIEDGRKAKQALVPQGAFYDYLGGSRVRSGIDAQAAAQAARANQVFTDQHDAIGLSQTTRNNQLNSLLARDPTGAAIAGLVGSTKAEQQRLYNSGFKDLADKQGDLGLKELKLDKQNYLDGFRGQELDLRHFDITNPRDTEDVGKVMKEFKNAEKDIADNNYDLKKGDPENAAGKNDEKLDSINKGIQDLLSAINGLVDGG